MKVDLNESWMTGKYKNGEIDWALSTIEVYEPDWYFQGHEADHNIRLIHEYWLNNDVTTEEAFDWWVNAYLH